MVNLSTRNICFGWELRNFLIMHFFVPMYYNFPFQHFSCHSWKILPVSSSSNVIWKQYVLWLNLLLRYSLIMVQNIWFHIESYLKGTRRTMQMWLSFILTIFSPVIYSLTFLGSIYCKQVGPRSDCSKGSSLIMVHSVCFHEKVLSDV